MRFHFNFNAAVICARDVDDTPSSDFISISMQLTSGLMRILTFTLYNDSNVTTLHCQMRILISESPNDDNATTLFFGAIPN